MAEPELPPSGDVLEYVRLLGGSGADPIPPEYMRSMGNARLHASHGSDPVTMMRPTACETCAAAVEVLREVYRRR